MDEDTLVIVLVVFGIGVAAWLLLRGKPAAAPPPCNVNVAYSGVGVGIPCGAIKDVAGAISAGGQAVAVGIAGAVSDLINSDGDPPLPCSGNVREQMIPARGGFPARKIMIDLHTGKPCIPSAGQTVTPSAPVVRTPEQQAATVNRIIKTTQTQTAAQILSKPVKV